jgi:hypothetical protein
MSAPGWSCLPPLSDFFLLPCCSRRSQRATSDLAREPHEGAIRSDARVWRYSDDFRIATDSWSDALAAVDLLEREVRRIGLTLNDSNTVIRRGERTWRPSSGA